MYDPYPSKIDSTNIKITEADRQLHRQLEQAAGKCLYEACDSIAQDALYECQWDLTMQNHLPVLNIICPDPQSYWQILTVKQQIANNLMQIMSSCKICIHPPRGKCLEVEIRENLTDQ